VLIDRRRDHADHGAQRRAQHRPGRPEERPDDRARGGCAGPGDDLVDGQVGPRWRVRNRRTTGRGGSPGTSTGAWRGTRRTGRVRVQPWRAPLWRRRRERAGRRGLRHGSCSRSGRATADTFCSAGHEQIDPIRSPIVMTFTPQTSLLHGLAVERGFAYLRTPSGTRRWTSATAIPRWWRRRTASPTGSRSPAGRSGKNYLVLPMNSGAEVESGIKVAATELTLLNCWPTPCSPHFARPTPRGVGRRSVWRRGVRNSRTRSASDLPSRATEGARIAVL
jgi:hypothetical protein